MLVAGHCRNYSSQCILVHELGHAVMNLGMDHELRARLQVGRHRENQGKDSREGGLVHVQSKLSFVAHRAT